MSFLATERARNKPNERHYPDLWDEERSLAAMKNDDGNIVIRHEPTANVPNQMWKFTKMGY